MPNLVNPVVLMLVALAVQPPLTSFIANPVGGPVIQAVIPEATEDCSDDEAKWWQALRAAGPESVAANRHKEQAVREARSQARQRGRVLGDDEDALSRKERDKLNADVETARQNYAGLLREGQEKSYRAPIRDTGRPIVLFTSYPSYTEAARLNKTMGRVRLQIEFRADGTIGAVDVLQGLADGLNQQAIDAVRRMVFLPATRDRLFVTISKSVEIDFNLR
jgi:TonB family protein